MYEPPRDRDYLTSPEVAEPPIDESDATERVFVMLLRDGTWHASWQGRELLGEFDGTRAEAVAWARERCERVLVYSEELGDLVPLTDEAPGT